MAMLVSCNAATYYNACSLFRMQWGVLNYWQSNFFSWNSVFVHGRLPADVVCLHPAQTACIQPGGFELLDEAALRINGARVDFNRTAWNFGFTFLELRAWRELRLRPRYEAWMRLNRERRVFPPVSLGYGLGLPLLAFADVVQCFDPSRVRIVEGLGFMDLKDLQFSNLSAGDVERADVLHYTGARKPWQPDAVPEFAAPFRRHDSPARAAGPEAAAAPPRRLFVLVGGERSGMEWAMGTLDAHPDVCASGEAKDPLHERHSFARHALGPPAPDLARSELAGDQVARCSRDALCTWRHVSWLATAGGDASAYSLQRDVATWRAFWAASGGNRSALFERFVRSALLGDTTAPGAGPDLRLPCTCPRTASLVGFKFVDLWTEDTHAAGWAAGHGTRDGAAALAVLHSLGATFVSWERASPADAYVSLQRSLDFNSRLCTPAGCPNQSGSVRVDPAACRSYVARHAAARTRLAGQLAALGVTPERFVFEECAADQPACFGRLAALLGISPGGLPFIPPRAPDAGRRAVANYDELMVQCNS